jgi:hypothetical protein
MSFDTCSDCGGASEWYSAFRLVLFWATPTVLFALCRQLPGTSPWSSLLAVFLLWAVAGATIASLFEIGWIDVDRPVQGEVIRLVVKGALISALAILAYRRLGKRRFGDSSASPRASRRPGATIAGRWMI